MVQCRQTSFNFFMTLGKCALDPVRNQITGNRDVEVTFPISEQLRYV